VDDQTIIKQVQSGKTEAFSLLVRRHQQMAFSVAMSVVKQEADARDVVQQAFLQAFTGLNRFGGKARFSTWLCRIVINEALRVTGKAQRGKEIEEIANPLETPVSINEALAKLKREDQANVIRKVLALMPSKEALVLNLFYLQGLSVKETAYCSGLTANHVKVLLSRARNKFYTLSLKHAGIPNISELY